MTLSELKAQAAEMTDDQLCAVGFRSYLEWSASVPVTTEAKAKLDYIKEELARRAEIPPAQPA